MRIAIAVVVVVAGACKDKPARKTTADDGAAWVRIEELARPRVPATGHEPLAPAIAIAERNRAAWSDRRMTRPPPPLADWPEGREAVNLLVTWFQHGGGLPPAPPLPGPRAMQLLELGQLAIETATDAEWTGIIAGAALGHRLVTQGSNVLDAMIGATLLADARRKAAELGDRAVGWELPVPGEMVRIVAAEAAYARRMATYLETPEGKRAVAAQVAGLDPAAKERAEQLLDQQLDELRPDAAELAALRAFWIAALADARPGEAPAVTLARIRKALAMIEHPKAQRAATAVVAAFDRLSGDLAALWAPEPSSSVDQSVP